MNKIGFIGLGRMGLPMAVNLVRHGFQVLGHDVSPSSRRRAFEAGIVVTEEFEAACFDAEAIVTMLPSGTNVLAAYDGPRGILAVAQTGTLLIDCSSIDIASARKVHAAAAKAGMQSLDAPVSGGTVGASAGKLTFMVGGAAEVLGRAKHLFEAMGQRTLHCGPAGAGQVAKICNNMLLGISMVGTCEAFLLADRLGLSLKTFHDVASTSSGQCWALSKNCPVPGVGSPSPADHGFQPGFSAELMLKDLVSAQRAAEDTQANTPLGTVVMRLYEDFVGSNGAQLDFSAIIQHLSRAEGKPAFGEVNYRDG